MWFLALAVLAALLLSFECKTCNRVFEPLNKTISRLEFNGSRSWHEVDSMCKDQFPGGFLMLNRDFLSLSEGQRTLCPQGQLVPLRLQKIGLDPILWRESHYFSSPEQINRTYMAHYRGPESLNETAHAQVGSLDLTTNQWHLVDDDTTFTCAICQRAWVDYLSQLDVEDLPKRSDPFLVAYTFRLVKTVTDNVTIDKALQLAVDNLKLSVDDYYHPHGITAEFEKLARDPGGHGNETFVRVRASRPLNADDVIEALNGSYAVESWWNVDKCPSARIDGMDWKEIYKGRVSVVKLPEFHVATKRCWIRLRGQHAEDSDAVWDQEVHLWIDRGEQCKTQGVTNLVQELEDFVARPAGDHSLESLVEITTVVSALGWPTDTFYETTASVSTAIFSALSALLIAKETNSNASSACNGYACAFIAAQSDQMGNPDTVVFTDKDTPPTFFDSKVVDHANHTFFMSTQIPSPSAHRMAIHTERGVDTRQRLFYPHGDFQPFSLQQAVLVHVTLPTPFETWQAEGKWPMTFRVKRTQIEYNEMNRYLSVWSRGDTKESTMPCPLVQSEGWIDTYECNAFVGAPRNFTSGTFLALKGSWDITSYGGILNYADDVFLGYTEIPIDESALRMVAKLTELVIVNRRYMKSTTIHDALDKILSGVVLNETVATVILPHIKVLESDLTGRDPVVGFSLDGLTGVNPTQTIDAGERNNVSSESVRDGDISYSEIYPDRLPEASPMYTIADSERSNVSRKSVIDLVLGAKVELLCKQLAILATSSFEDFYPDGSLGTYIKRKLMVVHLVANARSTPDESSKKAVYLDIQLHRDRVADQDGVFANDSNRRFLVATWSDEQSDWSVSNCGKLRSTRASKQVFRCQQLAIVGNEFHGRFLIFESFRFAEALSETWLGVLIAAGVLSGVSLASIAGTAATQASWRDDLGHKILMHMTLALTLNLALGFASPFVSFDTTGVPCVVVGALRHFSYLAMFAWMLVMSSLQLRRLLSMIGARATPNLVPKVSLLAWGLPTVTVALLLAFNREIYRSDVADRGFCYPEGDEFVWSVQVPAGAILHVNGLIFIVILARMYEFCGWGEKEDLRRHLNESTLQLHRIRATFYTFCIFGITWIFHLLAEQGVFQKKHLYEYLFLMTASFHVFFLACIFVFFDKEVRFKWVKLLARLVGRSNQGGER